MVRISAQHQSAPKVNLVPIMVGKLVNVMMMVAGGDAFQVIGELNRDGYPERLKNYADFLPQAFSGGSA